MIAIVDYKAGNLTSVKLALEHIGVECEITDQASRISKAERIIFPGVGAAAEAMRNLTELGLIETLKGAAEIGTPFLGICLGTQIILEYSEEDGGTPCIGLIPGKVRRFTPADPMCKIPQMGWNTVKFAKPHPLFTGIEDESEFYFVHSYYPSPENEKYILAETEYADVKFASIIGEKNIFAMQFHPERSGRIGMRILENFSRWDGSTLRPGSGQTGSPRSGNAQ